MVIKLAAKHISAALVFGLLFWSNGAADADDTQARAAGAAIAQDLCSGCHIVAEGQREASPDGIPPFPIIAGRPGRTLGYLQAYLTDPTPPMPHVPLSKREIDNVIAYILSFAD